MSQIAFDGGGGDVAFSGRVDISRKYADRFDWEYWENLMESD